MSIVILHCVFYNISRFTEYGLQIGIHILMTILRFGTTIKKKKLFILLFRKKIVC